MVFVQRPSCGIVRRSHCYVAYHGHPHIGMRFEAEGHYGYHNKKHRDDTNYLEKKEIVILMMCGLFVCNRGHCEVSTGSSVEAMSIPFTKSLL